MNRPSLTACRSSRRQSSIAGFTLLELVIVLAVLATIAAVAWPQLQPGLSRAGYRSAALQLKSEFAEAREQAIHDGRIREVRIKPGTGRYLVSVAGLDPHGEATEITSKTRNGERRHNLSDSSQPNRVTTDDPGYEFRELPGDLIFRFVEDERDSFQTISAPSQARRDSEQPLDNSSSSEESLEEVLDSDTEEWLLGVRFFPDGRATEETIELEDLNFTHTITLQIRGLTGGVTIGPVVSLMTDEERRAATNSNTAAANPPERQP